MSVVLAGAQDTQGAGRRLATVLRPGDLVLLDGPLGAGKTTFTRGLAEGLGVRGPVTSPTFVIARRHPSLVGGPALVHVDAYRLSCADDLYDLDLEAEMTDAVTVVEWGRDRAEGLGESRLEITFDRTTEDRFVTVAAVGTRWDSVDVEGLLAGAIA